MIKDHYEAPAVETYLIEPGRSLLDTSTRTMRGEDAGDEDAPAFV